MSKITNIIDSNSSFFRINFKEIYSYKSMIKMLVVRDFVTYYKQTILGPVWFFIQPLFQAAINLFVFGSLAGIGPEGVPGFLFFLSGPILWQYFQDCFTKIANVFVENQSVFGKVYFPRIIVPISIIFSNLLKFGVQLLLLVSVIVYYYLKTGVFYIGYEIIFFPFLLLLIMMISMGFGLIVTSLTSKYRDLRFVIEYGIPLFKYITPGIATTFIIFENKLSSFIVQYNPLGYIIDSFNCMFNGAGEIRIIPLIYVSIFSCFILYLGLLIFNRTSKKVMDTI